MVAAAWFLVFSNVGGTETRTAIRNSWSALSWGVVDVNPTRNTFNSVCEYEMACPAGHYCVGASKVRVTSE